MRVAIAVLAVVLIIGLAQAVPAKEKPTSKCNTACTDDYTPVCGGVKGSKDKPISFGNECVMQKYNCENKKSLTVLSQNECPGGGGVRLQ
ncbi:AAEL000211-PA [Aedes aegypti]|uniref:AAEL000211-PA n=2 Tax=Aedes aegypti TaxID=7159 RepID=A0A1S4EV97_AEDAE|nr:turripeptide Pal9.2 [Aedes aegypti]EAT48797.1 AAEL000211-PA [Aedes aegypti]